MGQGLKSQLRKHKASREKKKTANFCYLGLYKNFLDIMSKAQSIKEKTIKWISSKLRTSALQKTPQREWKDIPQIGMKYLQISNLIIHLQPEYF